MPLPYTEQDLKDLVQSLRNSGILTEKTELLTLIELINLFGQYHEIFQTTLVQPKTDFDYENETDYLKPAMISALPVKPVSIEDTLSKDQAKAWAKLKAWVYNDEPYFILRGYAGTGKSYLMALLTTLSKLNIYYTAPTNKAANVLATMIKAPAKTTYSALGLRMEQNEDELILTTDGTRPYFPPKSILVVDEASMAGAILCGAIDEVRTASRIKVLLMGDPAQIPPVGESKSAAWYMTSDPLCRAMLKQVMRYDSQLLILATAIRQCIKTKTWISPLVDDRDPEDHNKGVFKYRNSREFENAILNIIETVDDAVNTKVIAWRNKTVDYYNNFIRRHLGFNKPFCETELIMIAEPIERDGTIVAYIDEEFKITSVGESVITVDTYSIPVWVLYLENDKSLVVEVAKDNTLIDSIFRIKANNAKNLKGHERKQAWSDFWDTKKLFNKVRYAYGLTAHRSQGSTYKHVFVDQRDILLNHNKREAFKCLYVADTRGTDSIRSY